MTARANAQMTELAVTFDDDDDFARTFVAANGRHHPGLTSPDLAPHRLTLGRRVPPSGSPAPERSETCRLAGDSRLEPLLLL